MLNTPRPCRHAGQRRRKIFCPACHKRRIFFRSRCKASAKQTATAQGTPPAAQATHDNGKRNRAHTKPQQRTPGNSGNGNSQKAHAAHAAGKRQKKLAGTRHKRGKFFRSRCGASNASRASPRGTGARGGTFLKGVPGRRKPVPSRGQHGLDCMRVSRPGAFRLGKCVTVRASRPLAALAHDNRTESKY